MKTHAPLVSIICPTYNHEKFIADALDGFVVQRTSFSFEIIVHDDASTDSTAAIVRAYEAQYPHLFANIYQTENQFSKSIGYITRLTFAAARGKYIALCEGDDYWIDPLKLQKQVDFLEQHKDFAICFHRAKLVYDEHIPPFYQDINKYTPEVTTLHDLIKGNYIHTPTCVFRKNFTDFPHWFVKVPISDWVLHILNAQYGKIYFINEELGVYRIHYGGLVSTSQLKVDETRDFKEKRLKHELRMMDMHKNLAHHFEKTNQDLHIFFRNIYFHRKSYLLGIENGSKKNHLQRFLLIFMCAIKLKKYKLFIAAFLSLFFSGERLSKIWEQASKKKVRRKVN